MNMRLIPTVPVATIRRCIVLNSGTREYGGVVGCMALPSAPTFLAPRLHVCFFCQDVVCWLCSPLLDETIMPGGHKGLSRMYIYPVCHSSACLFLCFHVHPVASTGNMRKLPHSRRNGQRRALHLGRRHVREGEIDCEALRAVRA